MTEQAKQFLLKYYSAEVSGWEVMSWANSIDKNDVIDRKALEVLIFYDDAVPGYQREISRSLFKLIPNFDKEDYGNELMIYWLNKLVKNEITASEFVRLLTEMIYTYEEDNEEPCCQWAYNIFDAYNGYGFRELKNTPPNELYNLVYGYK